MKKYIIYAAVLLALGGIGTFQHSQIKKLREQLAETSLNLTEIESDNYSLTMERDQFKEWLETQNTAQKQAMDSVLKAHDIKVKDLKKIIDTKTTITIHDTVYMEPVVVESPVDNYYKLHFQRYNECAAVNVSVWTKDATTTLSIDKLETTNQTYSVVYKEPKKWWQIFKKRKYRMETYSNCGETTIQEIEIQ
jgi:regulator of replication initiation timing